ncbi:MAG: hypothetical protein G01um101418_742 [Parcubacteria group bacterium Gr01-1014_18]|nr:MAG: hypothetical protein Greene041636_732 [Parcubacteria group bacterium Greene0416_36]TSC80234.1 MAG: hypothetical protein G01um101418_742 [Parcubacteria group bacterium Gr01-1014_18]TSC98416.1 MAG: hypothetical protein Greene101420_769 [Parcubacteria group bacterium Greene1014_20]TSD06957.1 MAG: hypothetical protein Greene07142_520 [Parcubacteria group bacterium Greene0714_2]
MITFIKTLKYDTKPENRDIFEYLSQLALQKIDPPSISNASVYINADFVFHSPLRRVADTLERKENCQAISVDALREILFDIPKLCTREEWLYSGSSIIRNRFKSAFIADQLPVSRAELFDEIRKVLLLLASKPQSSSIYVVSHSFRLKIIEAFIKTKGMLESDPVLIHQFIWDDQKTYPFGAAFCVDQADLRWLT